jgi:uncharacterized protein YprB with RNaseH-like and TPR domain
MRLADKLRGVVTRSGGSDKQDPPYMSGGQDPPCASARQGTVAEILGGEWADDDGRYLVIDTRYTPGHRHGTVAVADCLPGDDGLWSRLNVLDASLRPGRLLFLDLETTGLGGGAGTYAFLVGCGWFEKPSAGEGAGFRVRQFLLSSHSAERAMLATVAAVAEAAAGVVSYNGKSFDVPLIETRFLFHRMQTPFSDLPHVDMLHSARQLWKSEASSEQEAQSCRLTTFEQAQLGHVRDEDIPGFEIPSRYFHYVRTGDPRPLRAVLEHNRLDLLAVAMLTARAAQLLGEGAGRARTAREALGLGRLYERSGLLADALASYERAAATAGASTLTQAEALRACAVLYRRERRFEPAAAAWRRILDLRRCPPQIAREAAEALAVHHEHRRRDLEAARRFALQTLQFNISRSRAEAVQYRLARLNRKLGDQPRLLGC